MLFRCANDSKRTVSAIREANGVLINHSMVTTTISMVAVVVARMALVVITRTKGSKSRGAVGICGTKYYTSVVFNFRGRKSDKDTPVDTLN